MAVRAGQFHMTHLQAQTNPGRHALIAPAGGVVMKAEDEDAKQGIVGGGLVKQEPAFIADLLDLPARHRSPAPEPAEVRAMTSSSINHVFRRMIEGTRLSMEITTEGTPILPRWRRPDACFLLLCGGHAAKKVPKANMVMTAKTSLITSSRVGLCCTHRSTMSTLTLRRTPSVL